ncbi:MAG: hypothetical protein U0Q03_11075 [Acidimicrobiales bacterium]
MDTLTAPVTDPDPIDLLIPPPRPWWVRLLVGLVVVGLVGATAWLVGFGYVYPRPDCCGSGGGSSDMALAEGGESVFVFVYAYNSSGRDLTIDAVDAALPGARVLGVTVNSALHDGPPELGPGTALPAVWRGHEGVRLAIRFVPESCAAGTGDWGSVSVRLDVVNAWLPSIDRTFDVPDAVVRSGQLSVFPPDDGTDWSSVRDPLEAACRLLGIADS